MRKKQSYSTSEVARFCHVTADTIRKWSESGRLVVFKTPGGHRRIRHEELLHFMRENKIPLHHELTDGGLRLLIIDDDRTVPALISRFFERSNVAFEYDIAEDGFEAGYKMAQFQPDLVFLNAEAPGLDGINLHQRIREYPELCEVRLILLNVGDEALPQEDGAENGVISNMAKPFTPDDLRHSLARVGLEIG